MKILLTGATGYIAKRLLPVLLEKKHDVVCCVRDKCRFDEKKYDSNQLSVIEVDFLEKKNLEKIPTDIDVAFYLIHSMSSQTDDFSSMEEISATNFKNQIELTRAKQIVYLSGIINQTKLSKHLASRKNVENILSRSSVPLTTLRAGIIIGSGSASFEIIRDLVEKLPIMIAPKWVNTKTQPIAIRNVIECLVGVINNIETFHQSYDIGGPEILTYKEMLLRFAKIRHLHRKILTVPIMTPRLSSYWLYFITSTSYALAKNLVDSMSVEIVIKNNDLVNMLKLKLIDYDTAIKLAFDKIEQNQVLSSWKDAQTSGILKKGVAQHIEVPVHGCYKDERIKKIKNPEKSLEMIWSIGGKNKWYYCNYCWEIRGFIDRLFGGVGLRRGRTNQTQIFTGEALDFWRVIVADKTNKRLMLYAEMKLPGEAWLEFKIDENNNLIQTATFRPLGLFGRLYWYILLPIHKFIFNGLSKVIANVE